MMRRAHAFVLGALVVLVASESHAAGPAAKKDACFAAAVKGQELRNAGKLIDARNQLIACGQASCPSEVVDDCARWLKETEAALPTIVVGARDDSGDIRDVRVFVDDVETHAASDGRPIALDPGPHKLRFVSEGRAEVEETIVSRAGEKNRSVIAVLAARTTVQHLPAPPPEAPPPSEAPRARSIPMLTWITGGAGVVSLGIFGGVGIVGLSDYNRDHCGVACSASAKQSVDSEFRVADVALGVGVAAIVAAAIIYFVSPRDTRTSATSLAR